jgi:hypothetical protein
LVASFGGGPNVNSRGTGHKRGVDLSREKKGKEGQKLTMRANTLRGSRLGGSRTSSQHFHLLKEAERNSRPLGELAGGYPT